MLRFTLTALGCKVNQYESEAIAHTLERGGLTRADSEAPADLVVVNSCCVTTPAMRKTRQAIRRNVRAASTHGSMPAVLVAGCYSDYDAQRLLSVLEELGVPPGRRFVIGHHGDLARCLGDLLASLRAEGSQPRQTLPETADRVDAGRDDGRMMAISGNSAGLGSEPSASPHSIRANRAAAVKRNAPGTNRLEGIERFEGHQRAFVKIQDGCDAFCTYCVVCYNRPVVRSRPSGDILDECRRLIDAGHREIVLCGVFLGAYGRPTAIRRKWDSTPDALADLLQTVGELPGLWRVRLSSLEPGDVTDCLLQVYRGMPAVAPHLHLPLQSGSDRILRRMNRQYTARQYVDTVARLRDTLNRPAITADVIAGFPSETEEDFARTLEVVSECGLSKVHAFPFSALEGTAAWTYRHEAPAPPVTRERINRLAEIEGEMASAYRRQLVGDTLEGLVETTCPAPGRRVAMTDRYLTVNFPDPADTARPGEVRTFRITAATDTGLEGETC
ncbi:MAG: MiaB/RimO family radical SAM methylthiotransferase [Phycisphaerae bacterium]